jgi:putative sterol carrier protein
MPHVAFSREWLDAWAAEIRASAEYREASRRWEWPLLFVLRADPDHGGPADRHVFLDLHGGECREARPGTADDVARAGFVLSADASTWNEVLRGGLDPVAGVMRGKLRLEKGSLTTLAMHTGAARALVGTAARVDTDFPGPP